MSRRLTAVLLAAVLGLAACSDGGPAAVAASPTPSPTPTEQGEPTLRQQVDQLYRLALQATAVKGDAAGAAQAMQAFASAVGVLQVPEEQRAARQRVSDAAASTAAAFQVAADVTDPLERTAALQRARGAQRDLEAVIRSLRA